MSEPPKETEAASSEPDKTKSGERQKSKADLNRVTDYVEERELDTSKVAGSMQQVVVDNQTSAKKRKKREKELAAVKIQQNDVDLIVEEMGLESREAERALREARGDVVEALCRLVR